MSEAVDKQGLNKRTGPSSAFWPEMATGRAGSTQARTRPLGLTILALASAAIGVGLLLWAGAWFGASDIVAGSSFEAVARLIVAMLVAVAVLELVLAFGVWDLKSWAWPLGVGLTIIAMVLTELSAGRGSTSAHTASLLLEIGTLWYLLSPSVHATLRPERHRTES